MNDDYQGDIGFSTGKSRLPVLGEVNHPTIWWPLAWGVIFLAIAIIAEYVLQLSGGTIQEVGQETPNPAGSTTLSSLTSLIFRWESVVIFLKEVGYAFIIGWIVSYFIDAAAKREQNDSFKRKMGEIGKQAFRGVFGLKHQEKYVLSVIENCLEARLVREGYSVAYTLDPFSAAEARRYGFETGRFVKVSAEIRYRARNVGTRRETFVTSYGIPVRSGKLQALSQLKSLKVGSKVHSPEEIKKSIVNDESDEKRHPDEVKYKLDFSLEPEESVEIAIEAQLIKEMSDSETFGFGLPTMDAKLALAVNLPNMVLGAAPRIIGKLQTERAPDDGRKGEWKIDHPVLPYNSVILWWRTKADDGSADSADGKALAAESATVTEPAKTRVVKSGQKKAAVKA